MRSIGSSSDLAGYQTGVRDGIRIQRDSIVTLSHSFSKMSGSLSISSQPAEAEAYLDGTPHRHDAVHRERALPTDATS